MPDPDHYSLFGVDRSAPFETIKKAYRDLAKRHHPDAGGEVQRMSRLNQAWATLKDTKLRETYDLSLPRRRGVNGTPATPPPPRQTANQGRYTGPSTFTTRPSATSNQRWRPVGVPFEDGHADWYAYLNIDANCDEAEAMEAIDRRREPALRSRGAAWAEMLLQQLARIEAILLDPAARADYDLRRVTLRKAARRPPEEGQAARRPAPPPSRPVPADETDWYVILGVNPRATPAEIRDAVTRRGRELESAQVSATAYTREKMRLTAAGRVLLNPLLRQQFDAERART